MEKRDKKFFVAGLIMMAFSSIISVYAASYLFESEQVSYDNTSSGLTSTNVQDSLDELYNHATDYTEIKSYFKNSPTSYFDANGLRLGYNGQSGESYVNFYINGVNRGAVGNGANGTMQVVSKDSNGVNGEGALYILGNPINIGNSSNNATVKINGTAIDMNSINRYVSITCTGNEASSDCITKIQNTYRSLNQGTYTGIINAGHMSGLLIFKATDLYGTVIRISYPNSATNVSSIQSMSISNGTWGSWIAIH